MKSKLICSVVLTLAMLSGAAEAGAQDAKPAPKTTTSKTAAAAQKPPQAGMVWANAKSKVYHKDGDQWYGKGKSGKWMTEADAKKAGYRASAAGATAPAASAKKSQ
jgi:hypothetical protein